MESLHGELRNFFQRNRLNYHHPPVCVLVCLLAKYHNPLDSFIKLSDSHHQLTPTAENLVRVIELYLDGSSWESSAAQSWSPTCWSKASVRSCWCQLCLSVNKISQNPPGRFKSNSSSLCLNLQMTALFLRQADSISQEVIV